jgi:transposase InsO family protein
MIDLNIFRRSKRMNKEEKSQQIALFRYSLIASAVAGTFEAPSVARHFRNVAAKKHKHPDGSHVTVNYHSLERWFYSYKKRGLAGITPKERVDVGKPRVLSDDVTDRIHTLREEFPYITGTAIYEKLIEEGALDADGASLSTIHRYIRKNELKPSSENQQAVLSFEMEFANDCWQADTSQGPVIKLSGKKERTFLISFIDDASRMIVHAQFYLNDNAVNMQDAFRQAIAKFGVPKMLYVDNGKTYDNLQLQLICASLGVVLAHSRPYIPKGRGKIERAFRTIKDGWMNAVDWNAFGSLDELNGALSTFLSEKYTNNVHSSLKATPKERFLKDYDKIRHLQAEELDFHFLHRKECRVTNAATIKLLGTEYEVPQRYIGSKIKIRYLPTDMSELFIFSDDNKLFHTVRPVKKIENSKIKRPSIDYTQAGGDI